MWLSAGELVVVGILALLVFGPEKLPELARQLARFVAQLQNIAAEVRRNVDEVIHEDAASPGAAPLTPPAPDRALLKHDEPQSSQAAAPDAFGEDSSGVAGAEPAFTPPASTPGQVPADRRSARGEDAGGIAPRPLAPGVIGFAGPMGSSAPSPGRGASAAEQPAESPAPRAAAEGHKNVEPAAEAAPLDPESQRGKRP